MKNKKKQIKNLSREDLKSIMGGFLPGGSAKQQSLCNVGGAWMLFDGNAAQAAIACGQTYGSACYSCAIS